MIEIGILIVVSFVQNMAFTWVSRSRNSGDPSYHRKAAYCSNSLWFFTNALIWHQVWLAIQSGDWLHLFIAGTAYTVATAEGSVYMMKKLLKHEKGSKRVGSYEDKEGKS